MVQIRLPLPLFPLARPTVLAPQAAWRCESWRAAGGGQAGGRAGGAKVLLPTCNFTLLHCCVFCSMWLNDQTAPQCKTLAALGARNTPSTWPLSDSSRWTVGFLSGTSSYSTVVNTYTWNLTGQATQLGSTGVTLASCAQICISSASCYAW